MRMKSNAPTLRDVALAALEIEADGGKEPVAWGRIVDRAHEVARQRAARQKAPAKSEGRS